MSSTTATAAENDAEDVNDFLKRIQELGNKRDQEDEERNRKLEEEILQGRRERQARRAERARSISPSKASPVSTPTSKHQNRTPNTAESAVSTTKPVPPPKPQLQSYSPTSTRNEKFDDTMQQLTGERSPTKENMAFRESSEASNVDPDKKRPISGRASPSNAMPSRTPTLSWQRRPTSQSSDRPRSRPLSMIASENAARSPRATPEPSSAADEHPPLTRDQIAQSLATKDPAWFRQTADRGQNSPAFRKNQVEDVDVMEHGRSSPRLQMPGMSHGTKPSSEDTDGDAFSTPSQTNSASGSGPSAFFHGGSLASSGMGSPIPQTDAQRFRPPTADGDFSNSDPMNGGRYLAMSPSQGRISSDRLERPASPTKGMGGFVQSAMMKRTDSVNKRWSVQSPTGLSRANSVASTRSNHDPMTVLKPGGMMSPIGRTSRPASPIRDSSPTRGRPTSSDSQVVSTQEPERPTTPSSATDIALGGKRQQETTPPQSPSRLSGRRSPTKASWLESALNKPESPKPKSMAAPSQPSWMAEIAKAKSEVVDETAASYSAAHKHEVNIGGLLRSPPLGGSIKPQTMGGLPGGFASSSGTLRSRLNSVDRAIQPSSGSHKYSEGSAGGVTSETAPPVAAKSNLRATPNEQRKLASIPAIGGIKPETPPKKDFRANLKPRQPPPTKAGDSEPEFKNLIGQLRRTKTQNYVAPDELKGNILRGKADLNLTGGPKKTERIDEFKDAILKKKEDFKKTQLEGHGVVRSASGGSQDSTAIPEALARAAVLGRSGTTTKPTEFSSPPRVTARRTSNTSTVPALNHETSAPARLQSKDNVGSSFAARFNPGLAAILARGPPPPDESNSRGSSPALSNSEAGVVTAERTTTETSGPSLTHMTKSRARGPKRKAPSNVSKQTGSTLLNSSSQVPSSKSSKSPSRTNGDVPKSKPEPLQPVKSQPISQASPKPRADAQAESTPPSTPRKLDMNRRSQFLAEAAKAPGSNGKPSEAERPPSPIKSGAIERSLEALKIGKVDGRLVATEVTPRTPVSPKPKLLGPKPSSVRSIPAIANGTPEKSSDLSPGSVKPPTDREVRSPISKANINSPPSEAAQYSSRPLPTPPTKPLSVATSKAPSPRKVTNPSQSGNTDTAKILTDFFGINDVVPVYDGDTSCILLAKEADSAKIKTLRSQLFLFNGSGKKQPVPAHQERILFENDLCLCPHTYGTVDGKRITETYLWIGDGVAESTVDDASLFALKEARSANGNLVVIRQGKETSEFIEALGGIAIIRRGSSNKYDSLAPHILCGRRHHGQVVFDEVEFSTSSFCSGFPYLVSTQAGKCYLWKGKGSRVDELSCARLIGMDMGITGEIDEIEEGSETKDFLQVFGPDAKINKSADHWRLKPNYSKYGSRLFCADGKADGSLKIGEIVPFNQADILPSKIYVLDAFFEIYIIVGSASQTQYNAFCIALAFAQEYGILAAGMEDRPFVPVSTVVLEGVPRDLKFVFRKWRDTLSPTTMHSPMTTLNRGRSLRVVTLNAALDAMQKSR